jgi:hypothetical protein
MAYSRANGQQVNGQTFSFPKGKTEWSDTVYKKLLTKDMAKEGKKAVLIGIRFKFLKAVDEGNWYEIEITNQSSDEKVEFKVVSKRNSDSFTVSLGPKQVKVVEKLYVRTNNMDQQNMEDTNNAYLNQLFDEMGETRY